VDGRISIETLKFTVEATARIRQQEQERRRGEILFQVSGENPEGAKAQEGSECR
jgi:hypothetical protein